MYDRFLLACCLCLIGATYSENSFYCHQRKEEVIRFNCVVIKTFDLFIRFKSYLGLLYFLGKLTVVVGV